ncbi:2-isopropylmalate synthase (Alpha-isopropylmalatesynthase) (Alpha-IPM synthetase) [Treponema primitia ZAS-2]|uniref:2-isopropylmalate synthase n=1 Tax=Treponema primitia (strain ATCC BAA-887 / DSM 12427 / ZAS-2) TaxID=545694 RepID=F5YPB3_TREPZ|nr:2-isopropylmalate synthase [Treponema primitia]AEF85124.1 2-isopropylmalate synthase (Alpha-isopropylmalatesynthase) (Alpha-IPM synthetase) [Treponema primitia ZAS-2]
MPDNPGNPPRRIILFDTTLREGDQAAGFAFSRDKKLALALSLAEAGVDIIETGFPLSNKTDYELCHLTARELPGRTAVMCRSIPADIRESAGVFGGTGQGTLHLSLPVSPIHIRAKLGKTEAEIIAMAREAVSFAAGLCSRVELGAEDATRADRSFLQEYCEAAFDAGADVVNIADTLGLFSPEETGNLIAFLCENIPSLAQGQCILSIHCHNDLGLACANTLAGILAGCGQAEVSALGLGERAGNAALEEVAANLEARPDLYRAVTGLKPERLPALLRLTAEASGTSLSPMKPLSGWNTRAHGSGIHQQGLSRDAETYSLPLLNRWNTAPERIVLTRHSGQAGVQLFAQRYCGLAPDEAALSRICAHLKDVNLKYINSFIRGSGAAGEGNSSLEITEFLCLLADMKLLPPSYAGPLVCLAFSETITEARLPVQSSADTHSKSIQPDEVKPSQVRVSGTAAVYGGQTLEFAGEGANETEAVLGAVRKLTKAEPRLRTTVTGYGERLRLYAEINVRDLSGEERLFAMERTGSSQGLLLFQCCLDAVNALGVQGKI